MTGREALRGDKRLERVRRALERATVVFMSPRALGGERVAVVRNGWKDKVRVDESVVVYEFSEIAEIVCGELSEEVIKAVHVVKRGLDGYLLRVEKKGENKA